ncbi:MAG: hypothetical protein J6X03_02965 [Bacilli bacterium]|nr:hypothetical protein [Bacilli bacterium]
MKKFNLLLTSLSACALLTLSSCDFLKNLTASIETETTATDWEGSWNLTQSFFEGTLKNTNQEVKRYRGTVLDRTEVIDGTKAYFVLADNSEKRYSFKDQDGKYVATYEAAGLKQYCVDNKDEYDRNFYRYFKDGPGFIEAYEQFFGVAYNCKVVYEGSLSFNVDKNHLSQTYTLEITYDGDVFLLQGTSVDGLVQTFTYQTKEFGELETMRLDFTYNNSSITPPNLDGYTKL